MPLISQISRKFKNILGPEFRSSPSFVAQTTYVEDGNQWYLPAIAGPGTFLPEVVGAPAVREALAVLEKLSADKYMDFVVNFYRAGLERFGDRWVYADINTVLVGLSRTLDIKSYLEIGVRRGRSMAMVAAHSPDCYIAGFDMWINNYAGMENPGKDFVLAEIERAGFKGRAEFFDGDSKITVPRYFKDYPQQSFDLITVDGDHSLEGARVDLVNVLPHLKVGGILVFDDISNQDHSYLAELWNDLIVSDEQYATYSFAEVGFGVAFAIKKRN